MEKNYLAFNRNILPEGTSAKQFYNVCLDLANNRFDGAQKLEAEESVRTILLKIFNLDEESVKNNKLYRRAVRDHRNEFFDFIEDVISVKIADTLSSNPFLSEFAEVRNLNYDDSAELWVEDATQEIYVAEYAGDHHDLTLQQIGAGKPIRPPRKRYVAAVGAHLRAYLLGQSDFNMFIQKVYEAFEKKVLTETLAVMADLTKKMPVGSPFVVTSQLQEADKDTVDTLIQNVKSYYGTDVYVMGTHSALMKLEKLTDVKWRSSDAREDKYYNGLISFYDGIPMVELPQSVTLEGNQFKQLIPNDFLFIIPRIQNKFVYIVNYGDPESFEVMDRGARIDDTIKFEYSQSFGVEVLFSNYLGIIKITN